jgi:S1-C subfamily serine protease
MRKLSACLATAFLFAAPVAVAGPDTPDSAGGDPWQEMFHEGTAQAHLGVIAIPMTPELRNYFGAPDDRGVLVGKIEPGSAAEAAGVHVGDVLTGVRGDNIGSAVDVREALTGAKQGDTFKVQVIRDKKALTLDATIRGTTTSELEWLRDLFPWIENLKEGAANSSHSTRT